MGRIVKIESLPISVVVILIRSRIKDLGAFSIHQQAGRTGVLLPIYIFTEHRRVAVITLRNLLAVYLFGIGIFRSRHLKDEQRHTVLHREAERVVAIHATGRHQVGGGVLGVGILVGFNKPIIDYNLKEVFIAGRYLAAHIAIVPVGIIGMITPAG